MTMDARSRKALEGLKSPKKKQPIDFVNEINRLASHCEVW